MLNKSLLTNLLAAAALVAGLLIPHPVVAPVVLSVGLFALSGAITNWLAVHMLFEKVPLLYGSGVVLIQFDAFKRGIASLMMDNFFCEENFNRLTEELFAGENLPAIDEEKVLAKVPYDEMFEGFVGVVEASSFGGMLNMVGGKAALEPMREPFGHEIGKQLRGLLSNPELVSELGSGQDTDALRHQIAELIDARLSELTPQMVKEIVQEMIHKHLDWLVVWGGVFGGLIGLASALIRGG